MNQQFHTPSFGDEVFEISDSAIESSVKRMRTLDYPSPSMEDCNSIENTCNINSLPTTQSTLSVSSPNQIQLPSRKQVAVITPLSSFNTNSVQNTKESSNLEPAKPLSPYALFFRDTINPIKAQNPTCNFPEISVIVSKMWETLDDAHKNHYNHKHEFAKQEYITAMRNYTQKSETQAAVNERNRQQQQQQQQQQNDLSSQLMKSNYSQFVQDSQQELMLSSPTLTMSVNSVDNITLSNSNGGGGLNGAAFQNDSVIASPPQQQIQLLTAAAATQKCTRENCNKPAIINPDWEDEYCSNECVVIHCRTVFNDWVKSKMNSSPGATIAI